MKLLKALGLILLLTCLGTAPALAESVCAPGDMNAPPCSTNAATLGDFAAPGEMNGPPAAERVDFRALAEMALESLMLF